MKEGDCYPPPLLCSLKYVSIRYYNTPSVQTAFRAIAPSPDICLIGAVVAFGRPCAVSVRRDKSTGPRRARNDGKYCGDMPPLTIRGIKPLKFTEFPPPLLIAFATFEVINAYFAFIPIHRSNAHVILLHTLYQNGSRV